MATPFERRRYVRDLEDSYRYYRRWKAGQEGVTYYDLHNDPAGATTLAQGAIIDADDALTTRWLNPPMNHKPEVETATDVRLATGQALYDSSTTLQENRSTSDHLNLHWDNGGGRGSAGDFYRLILKTSSGDFAVEAEI